MTSTHSASNSVYRRLYRYSLKYWSGFAIGFGAMIFTAATETAFPALMKPLLDDGFSQSEAFPIWWPPAIIILIFVIRGLSTFVSAYSLHWVSNHVLRDIRSEVFEKILSFPSSRFDQTSSGELISKIINETQVMLYAATNIVSTLVRDSLILMGLLLWMLWLNWQLTLVILTLAPLLTLLSVKFSKRLRAISFRHLQRIGALTRLVEESISCQRIIKLFSGKSLAMSRFSEESARFRGEAMRLAVAASLQSPVSQFIAALGVAAVVTLALMQSRLGLASAGEFVSFITAMLMMFGPLKHLAGINAQLQQGLAAAQGVFALLDLESEKDSGTRILRVHEGNIAFHNVSLKYETRTTPALHDISFVVPARSTLAIVGPSGGGKSSLAHLLPRLYEPSSGSISIDGKSITDFTLHSLRSQISLVSQDVVLLNDSIGNNIRYGKPDASNEDVQRSVREASLIRFVDSLPDGLSTEVGQDGVQLSGGQRQRISIARAFLRQSPIIVLDEVTSSLDAESEYEVQQAIERLRRGRTTIIIAHRFKSVETADFILVLEGGRVVQRGTHLELIEQSGLYRELHERAHRKGIEAHD